MILDIFKYFAKFPSRKGILAMATLGKSQLKEYSEIISELKSLPESDVVLPEVDNYLYAQSVDELQKTIQKLTGSFLLIDYGEISFSQRMPRAIEASIQVAATVAVKVSERADALERFILNGRALDCLNRVYAKMLDDSDSGTLSWLDRDRLISAQFLPFLSPELSAVGWTLMFEAVSVDPTAIRS